MNLDKSKEPTVRATLDGMEVVIFLEGNDSSVWKLDYDAAALDVRIAAHAINVDQPWAIALTLAAGADAQEQLRVAVGLIQKANEAYSDRASGLTSARALVMNQWRMLREPGPPLPQQ